MNARPLSTIEKDLEAAFQRERKGPIEIGGLLLEAKEQLDAHGRWLPWLRARFPHAVRTAQNYMSAYKFSLRHKSATVAYLKLSPGGLYALVEADKDDDQGVVERGLREAKTRWVDASRVHEIVEEFHRPPAPSPAPSPSTTPPAGTSAGTSAPAMPPDDDDDDDRPPPPMPPAPPGLSPKQARFVNDFDAAIVSLKALAARPAASFVAAGASNVDLDMASNFLGQVVRERSKPAAA
jgi:hypothetical protein